MSEYWDGVLTETADDASSAWSYRVGIAHMDESTGWAQNQAAVEFCGATAGIYWGGVLYDSDYGSWPALLQQRWDEWVAQVPEGYRNDTCTYWYAEVEAGTDTDTDYCIAGWVDTIVGPPEPPTWVGPTEWELAGSMTISNLVNTVRCGADWKQGRLDPTKDRLPIRSWHDRYAQYILCATDETVLTVSLGDLSAAMAYEFPAPEVGPEIEPPEGYTPVIIGGEANQFTVWLSCQDLHTLDADYCYVSQIKWGDVALDQGDRCHFWSGDGTTWVASSSQPSSTHLHILGVDGGVGMRRVGSGTSTASGSISIQVLGPLRYNLRAAAFAPDSEIGPPDEEETWSAYTGLSQYVNETTRQPVYLAQGLSDWYTQVWWYVTGDVGNRIKTGEYYFDFSFQGCRVKDSYLIAHHEYLDEGDNQTNHYGMVVLPSIRDTVSTDDPYWDGAIEIAHSDISVDTPPGKTERPTDWVGDGVTVDNETNTWTVGEGGGTVSRTLATRYFARMDYINAKVPEGGWWNADAPIWLKANAIEDDDDLPAAVTACPVEDVTNYDNASWLALSFHSHPSGAVGETVTLTLSYRLVWVYDPCYTCAEHRYMSPDGEWEYGYSEAQLEVDGVLTEGGTVLFDLGRLARDNSTNLQHVTALEFAFPASMAGEYSFDDVRLVADPEVGSDPVLNFQAAIAPWEFLADFTGAGGTASGPACLNVAYGYEDKRGAQRGMAQTQYAQHCPESEAQGDISAPKALSRLVNELNWQEQIEATYPTNAWTAAMEDDWGHVMGNGPYWWDLARGTGDALDGRGGIAVRNLVAVPYGTGPVPVTVNAFWTCGGRNHGMVYDTSGRVRGAGTSSGDPGDGDIVVYRAPRVSSPEWEACGSCDPDEYGRFRTPPMPEDYYQYRIGEDGATYQVVTREYGAGAVEIPATPGERDPDITLAPGGRPIIAYVKADGDEIVCRWWETTEGPPGEEATVATGDRLRHPSLVAWPDGSLGCWYMADGVQAAVRSTNGGLTWEAMAGMLADDLANAAICQWQGMTIAAGYADGSCVVEWSNDQGASKSAVPGGGTAVTVSTAMAEDGQPAITVLPSGQVLVLVPETDGYIRGYVSDGGGIAGWREAGEFSA